MFPIWDAWSIPYFPVFIFPADYDIPMEPVGFILHVDMDACYARKGATFPKITDT